MKVSEIFASIQGEGRIMGMPAAFVRLAGCNLNCEWCDTKYAWNVGKEMTVDEIVSEVNKIGLKDVVITGGEPLVQIDELSELVSKLYELGYVLHIETNGTIAMPREMESRFLLITVSPKKQAINIEVLSEYAIYSADFKFVVGFEGDNVWSEDEIKEIEKKLELSKDDIWVMPVTYNGHIDTECARKVWEMAVRNKWNYSDRLHVRVWGGVRGK